MDALALEHKWELFDTIFGDPEFTKDAQGFVHLKGGITGRGSTSMQFAVLPAGFRPPTEGVWCAHSGNERPVERSRAR